MQICHKPFPHQLRVFWKCSFTEFSIVNADLKWLSANQKMEYRQLSWGNLNTLCKQFHGIQWILIDEFSMVGNHMLWFIYLCLQEIRGNKVPFGGINIVCVGDLFQLQPVMQQYIFLDLTSDYGPLATNLWTFHNIWADWDHVAKRGQEIWTTIELPMYWRTYCCRHQSPKNSYNISR